MSDSFLLEKCCLVGESVRGNPTHFMVEQAFAAAGVDWRFMTFEVSPEKLIDAVRGIAALGFQGALLLPSFQRLAWEHVQTHTERSQRTGCVSCLVRRDTRLVGDDLSGESLVAAIVRTHPVAGRHAVVLGVGGRGGPTAHSLLGGGVASLTLVSMDGDEAEQLADQLRAAYPDRPIECASADDDMLELPDETSLLVCSASWPKEQDDAVARLAAPWLRREMVVADARVRSGLSPLLHAASDRGAEIVGGVQILVQEVADAVRMWTGVEPSAGVLQDAAEEFLGV